jgi:hypothetical protein
VKMCVRVEVYTSTLFGSAWSASRAGRFNPCKTMGGTYWVRGWMGPKPSVKIVEQTKFVSLFGKRPGVRPKACRYTDCTIRYTDCTIRYTDCTIRYTDCTIHYTDCTIRYTDCTIRYTDCTIRYTDCTISAHFPLWHKIKLDITENRAGIISHNREGWYPFRERSIFHGSELVTSMQTERGQGYLSQGWAKHRLNRPLLRHKQRG